MTVWKGPDRGRGIWATEIRLRNVTPTRRGKVAKLLALLKREKVVEVGTR